MGAGENRRLRCQSRGGLQREGQRRPKARKADSRHFRSALALPQLLGIRHAEPADVKFRGFPSPTDGSRYSGFTRLPRHWLSRGRVLGGHQSKPGTPFPVCRTLECPRPPGRRGALVNSAPLFFLLVLFLRLHTEQCACVIFPLNFLSAASLAGERRVDANDISMSQ